MTILLIINLYVCINFVSSPISDVLKKLNSVNISIEMNTVIARFVAEFYSKSHFSLYVSLPRIFIIVSFKNPLENGTISLSRPGNPKMLSPHMSYWHLSAKSYQFLIRTVIEKRKQKSEMIVFSSFR